MPWRAGCPRAGSRSRVATTALRSPRHRDLDHVICGPTRSTMHSTAHFRWAWASRLGAMPVHSSRHPRNACRRSTNRQSIVEMTRLIARRNSRGNDLRRAMQLLRIGIVGLQRPNLEIHTRSDTTSSLDSSAPHRAVVVNESDDVRVVTQTHIATQCLPVPNAVSSVFRTSDHCLSISSSFDHVIVGGSVLQPAKIACRNKNQAG